MGWAEFILLFVAEVIVGLCALTIIAYKFGRNAKDKNKK